MKNSFDDNKNALFKVIGSQNRSMLPKAIPLFFLMVPYTVLMIGLVVFVFFYYFAYASHPLLSFGDFYSSLFKIYVKIFRIIKYSINPYSYKKILEYNEEVDSIEEVLIPKIGIYHTENLLFIKNRLSFDILPKNDVVWVYTELKKNSTSIYHNKISSSSLYTIVIKTLDKKTFRVPCYKTSSYMGSHNFKDYDEEQEIMQIAASCCNAVIGYNDDYKKLYKKDPYQLIQLVSKTN